MNKVTTSKGKPSKKLFTRRLCNAAKIYLAQGDEKNLLRCIQLIEDSMPHSNVGKFQNQAEELCLFLPPKRSNNT